jgi:hypothetical protein
MVLSTPNARRKPLRVAFGKRTFDSGIFAGFVWSVQGRQNFRPADAGFGVGLSVVFPTSASPDESEFLPMPGVGCMMWQWETKDSQPSEPRNGYCGLAGTFAFTAQ